MKIFSALFDRSFHLWPRLHPGSKGHQLPRDGWPGTGTAPAGWPARVRQLGPIPAPQPGASGAFPGMGRGARGGPSSAAAMAGPGCGELETRPASASLGRDGGSRGADVVSWAVGWAEGAPEDRAGMGRPGRTSGP